MQQIFYVMFCTCSGMVSAHNLQIIFGDVLTLLDLSKYVMV